MFMKPEKRIFQSLELAIDWLREHSFTDESIEILEQMWYKRMFGYSNHSAYQDASDNADKPHV